MRTPRTPLAATLQRISRAQTTARTTGVPVDEVLDGALDQTPRRQGRGLSQLLGRLEALYPGLTAAYRGVAYRDAWARDPWHHGAYSYYRVGQYTDFGGYEKHREGNRFFCGEHTSVQFQGYMEGALRSGELAAIQIGARL